MGKWKNHRADIGGSPKVRHEAMRRQEMGWARRRPHAELTTSPEADGQAAGQRQLAELEAERQRQAS
jgi:hypothetical protein